MQALAYLGIPCTTRGEELEIHAEPPPTEEEMREALDNPPDPEPTERELAIQEAIKDEPADSPVRLLAEALLGRTAAEIEAARK